jgi:cytochrome c1
VQEQGCTACHTIPSVPGATSTVGPPLTRWAERRYIAGTLINTPDNLMIWLRNPQEIEPGTAMPYIPMSDQELRDIAAFLFTLSYD